jgi:cobalt/nickel transport system ATP-binding protein
MSLIDLEGISFQYPNGNQVLEGLSLRLEEGDKIGLLGENGTGKTTLFHIILGLLKPTKGEITIFGKKRETEQDFKKIRGAIGLLFQDSDDQLFCPTVMEDVAFGPLNMGMNHHEATERAEQTLEELGISRFRNRVPYQLSGGEKRLVSMATILSMRPEILLLDEPTTRLFVSVESCCSIFLRCCVFENIPTELSMYHLPSPQSRLGLVKIIRSLFQPDPRKQ